MKSLALYVDKWYIVGTHCGNGEPRPLRISNGDDRIWLYFYNDRDANQVSYSSKYKEKAFAEEIDYYKDIFKLIPTDVGATFKRFGRNVEIRKIFNAAGIFDDLRTGYQKDEKIRTFISFSQDISYLAQSVFLSLLNEHGFEIIEFVAHIGHLTLEYAYRHKLIEQSNLILVANACNENLRLALYQQAEGIFVCRKECLHEGLGIDLRKRAILEQVVEYLDAESRFICNESERKEEYKYLQQYVDDWIKLLDADKECMYKPTPLGNLHLKKQQGNNYPISVMRSEIDNRTSVIIDDIVKAMLRMLSENGSGTQNLSHIVFLGNTFENSIFEKKLIQQKGVNSSHILHFREEQLSEIVSVYADIDCSQFKEAENKHKKDSDAEKARAEQAKRERKAMEEAQKKEAEAKAIRDKEKQKQKNYDAAIEDAESAEKDEEYEKALGLYKTAKTLAEEEQKTRIQHKIEHLGNIIADIRSKKKQFNEYIENAKQCISEKRWEDAIVQSQMALGVMPKSEEAMQILTRAKDMNQRYVRLKECLSQIDFFIAQGAFDNALEELHQAELLNLNDASIEDRRIVITQKQKELRELIENEKKVLDNALNDEDFQLAIRQCELLFDIDTNHQSQWAEKKASIVSTREKVIEIEKHFQELIDAIDKSLLNEEWDRLELLCVEALKIKNDSAIQEKLDKARKKILILDVQRQFDDARNAEDWKLIIDYSIKYPFLKETRDNNKTIQYARRQIQISRNNNKKARTGVVIKPSDSTEQDGRKKDLNPVRPKVHQKVATIFNNPITLLQEPQVDINIDSSKKRFPHPKKYEKKKCNQEVVTEADKNTGVLSAPTTATAPKRKFPNVSHIKK